MPPPILVSLGGGGHFGELRGLTLLTLGAHRRRERVVEQPHGGGGCEYYVEQELVGRVPVVRRYVPFVVVGCYYKVIKGRTKRGCRVKKHPAQAETTSRQAESASATRPRGARTTLTSTDM